MPLIGFGAIALIVALILFFIRRSYAARVALIERTQHVAARDVGPALLGELVEVQGRVACQQPLIAPLSHRDCVYYAMQVEREYEVRRWETDSQGNRRERVDRRKETLASDTRWVPFIVEDDSGWVRIDVANAVFELTPFLDTFDRDGGSYAEREVDGGFLGNLFRNDGNTIGYHFHETMLPVESMAYILGEVKQVGNDVTIGHPQRRKAHLIIADRTEEQLTKDMKQTMAQLLLILAIAGVIGLGLVIAGSLQLMGVIGS